MKFLIINHQQDWGTSIVYINLQQLKCIEYDFNPNFIRIYYLDKCIKGFIHRNSDEVGSFYAGELESFLRGDEKSYNFFVYDDHADVPEEKEIKDLLVKSE